MDPTLDPTHMLVWIKALLAAGLAGYLTIFVLNNITDPGTNGAAIERMMTMRELKADPPWGAGVLWRAIDSPRVHRGVYYGVIAAQAVCAVLLWWAVVSLVGAALGGFDPGDLRSAVGLADLGLLLLLGIWLSMILAGLWFTYWLKMASVQISQMLLFIATMLVVLVMNVGTA